MGYAAPTPWLSEEAAQAISGKSISEDTAKAAQMLRCREPSLSARMLIRSNLRAVAVSAPF